MPFFDDVNVFDYLGDGNVEITNKEMNYFNLYE